MISNVIVTNRDDAPQIIKDLSLNNMIAWITICSKRDRPLISHSNKHTLVCKFDDISINPITHSQARKIKNFILNHHINMMKDFILVINCRMGISRSAGVGMFCKHNLNLNVNFGPETFPNNGVMKSLGVNPKFWCIQLIDMSPVDFD